MPFRLVGHISDPKVAELVKGGSTPAAPASTDPQGMRKVGHISDPQFAALRAKIAPTYPQDASGAYHAEDAPTAPYQPVQLEKGGSARWFSQRDIAKITNPEITQEELDKIPAGAGHFVPLSAADSALASREDEQAARINSAQAYVPPAATLTAGPLNALRDIDALLLRGTDAIGATNFGDEMLNNLALQSGEIDAAADKQAGGSKWQQYVRGGLQSATTSLIGGRLAGPAGAIALQSGIQGNQAYAEGIQGGMTHDEALAYGAKMGAAEGVVGTAFQMMGLGGLERAWAREGVKQPLKQAIKNGLKQYGIRTALEELPEELMTQVIQNRVKQEHNGFQLSPETNPDGSYLNDKDGLSPRIREYIDVIGQTAVAMGMSESTHFLSENSDSLKSWITRNPDKAKAIAELPENPSRKQIAEAAGFDADAPSTLAERSKLREETRNNFRLPNVVTKWSNVEAGDMVSYLGRPWIVENRSDSGNRFTLYDETGARQENIDRRELKGYQKLPKPQEQRPDSAPTDVSPTQLGEAWQEVSPTAPMPEGAIQFTDPKTGIKYARQGEVAQKPEGVIPNPIDDLAKQAVEQSANRPQPTEQVNEAQPATEPVSAAQPQAQVPQAEQAPIANEAQEPVSKMVEAGVKARYKNTSGVDLGEFVEPSQEHAEAVEWLAARGKKVRFFKNNTPKTAPAFYDPATDTIYVHADRKGDALWYAIGHEYAHASGADERLADLPESLIEEAKAKYLKGAAAPYRATLLKNERMLRNEAVARYLGDFLADPERRARMQRHNPNLWEKIKAAIVKMIGPAQSKADQRVLEELAKVEPVKPTNAAVTKSDSSRYDTYAGFANPAKGTITGAATQAVREGMGDNVKPTWTRDELVGDAKKQFESDPQGARTSIETALASGQPLSKEQTALANIIKADLAAKMYASNKPADIAEFARFERAYTKQRSEAGSTLRAGQEDLMQTPEGRQVLIAQELTALSSEDQKSLDELTAQLLTLGGNPDIRLSDDIKLADSIDRETERRTVEEKSAVRAVKRDDNVARAQANLAQLELKIARKQALFRQRMERKGIIPATPQGIQNLLSDPMKTLYALRQMRAYKNLGRGMGSTITGGRVGLNGLWDALYEASMANILSGLKTLTVNAAGTPINYLGHLVPRALEATTNAGLKLATGGRAGRTGAQWGELRHLTAGMWQGLKQGWMNAGSSIWNEVSALDQQSGRSGSSLETLGGDYAIPGKLGWLIRAPGYGTNRFFDDLSRTAIAHMEARARAYRLAVETNVPAANRNAFVDQAYNDQNSPIWKGDQQGAYEYANKMAFQETGGETRKKVVNALLQARKDIPGVRWFLRFIKFPVNAAVQTKEWTPFHFWHVVSKGAENLRSNREWSYGIKEDMAKAFVGTLAMALIWDLLEDEKEEGFFGITGSSHPDKDKRNTFRIGSTRIGYRPIEPYGSALSMLVDTAISAKRGDKPMQIATSAAVSLGDTVINKPVMRGIQQIADYAREVGRAKSEGNPKIAEKAAQKMIAEQTMSFMPRIVTQFFESTGDEKGYEKRKRTMAELFDLEISDVAEQWDAWGRKKEISAFGNPVGDFAWRLLTPIEISSREQHKGDILIGNWNAMQGPDTKRFRLPELSANYTKEGKPQRMTPEQFQQYAQLTGKYAAGMFKMGKFTPNNPTQVQMDALDGIFDKARQKAKEAILDKGGVVNPEIEPNASTLKLMRSERIQTLQRSIAGYGYNPKHKDAKARKIAELKFWVGK